MLPIIRINEEIGRMYLTDYKHCKAETCSITHSSSQ